VSADAAPTLEELLKEWDEQTAVPHEPIPVAPPVGERPRAGRLSFSPPPAVFEPTFNERVDPLLQPLRQRVEDAETHFYERGLLLEQEHAARMAEVEEAMKFRHDIEAAHAAIHNVTTAPSPAYELPSPEVMFNMHPQEFEKTVAEYRRRRNR
jgi:hypothetical protein